MLNSENQFQCPICGKLITISEENQYCNSCNTDLTLLIYLANLGARYFNESIELASKGDIDSAIEKIHASIAISSPDASQYIVLAKLYAKQGNFEQAKKAIEKAFKLDPNNEKAKLLEQEFNKALSPIPQRNFRPIIIASIAVAVLIIAVIVSLSFRTSPEDKVRKALRQYPELAGLINIDVNKDEIILSGAVQNLELKQSAHSIAKNATPRKNIDSSRISVDYKNAILSKLLSDRLTVTQEDNNLKIEGEVQSFKEKNDLKDLAKTLNGIGKIDDIGLNVFHCVRSGDTLQKISNIHYGTYQNWQKIYEKNKSIIKDKNMLLLDQKLLIPPIN